MIKSRFLRSAAGEHYAPQGLPRLRIRNCGSAQRGRQAHRSRNQRCADGCQNYYDAQHKIILSVLIGDVSSGVNSFGVGRKMRATACSKNLGGFAMTERVLLTCVTGYIGQ